MAKTYRGGATRFLTKRVWVLTLQALTDTEYQNKNSVMPVLQFTKDYKGKTSGDVCFLALSHRCRSVISSFFVFFSLHNIILLSWYDQVLSPEHQPPSMSTALSHPYYFFFLRYMIVPMPYKKQGAGQTLHITVRGGNHTSPQHLLPPPSSWSRASNPFSLSGWWYTHWRTNFEVSGIFKEYLPLEQYCAQKLIWLLSYFKWMTEIPVNVLTLCIRASTL